ncbi:MAG: replicative DNA helicase [Candidatus Aquicultorales bacterium]
MAEKTVSFERLEKLPPHNLEAEQSLIGAMLISPDAVGVAVEHIQPDNFYVEAHRLIYEAITDLYRTGKPSDAVTVADALKSKGQLEAAGGKPYIHTLVSAVPSTANAPYYAEIVERNATYRALIRAANEIAMLGYECPDDISGAIDRAETLIFGIANPRMNSKFVSIDELMTAGFEEIQALGENPNAITGVSSGFPDLDALTSGFHPGDLVILAARPSMGKTALALNMAANIGKAKITVAVFSLEMSKEQLAQRIMGSEGEINSHHLRTGNLKDTEWSKLADTAGRLQEAPIFVDDTPGLSIMELRAKTRRLFARHAPGLIIVDYLQLMQSYKKTENRQQEIAEISRGLKILAKEMGVPILALSQLSRGIEQREDKIPRLSDLRESGSIEQDADMVLFIHRKVRPVVTGEEDVDPITERRSTDLILAKHRNGPIGSVKLTFLENYAKFVSQAPAYRAPEG